MELEEMEHLQKSMNINKKLLDAGFNAFTGLRDTNNTLQGLLNGMFENNQKLIAVFEQLEDKLTADENTDVISAVTYVTKSNEVLLELLKVNKAIEGSLGDSITSISQEILAFTKQQ